MLILLCGGDIIREGDISSATYMYVDFFAMVQLYINLSALMMHIFFLRIGLYYYRSRQKRRRGRYKRTVMDSGSGCEEACLHSSRRVVSLGQLCLDGAGGGESKDIMS